MQALPDARGAYALFMTVLAPVRLTIGALGAADFPAGLYVYSGSALGPGGIRARLGRHLRGDGKIHWHIDFVRRHVHIKGFCYTVIPEHQAGASKHRLECQWSQTLANFSQVHIPVPRFGASDCPSTCLAHLVAFPLEVDPNRLCRLLDASLLCYHNLG